MRTTFLKCLFRKRDKVVEEWQNNNIKRDIEIEPIDKNLTNYKKIVLITSTW